MPKADLKPCPFCGATAHIAQLKWSATQRYFVACSKWGCIASEHNTFGRFFDNRDDAVNAWNRRANDAEG